MTEGKSRYDKIKIGFDLLWKVATIVLLLANLWLNQHFVSIEKYEVDRKEINVQLKALTDFVIKTEERNKVDERQNELLKDHEARLRYLEFRNAK